jgi:hypothetical protein
LPRLRPRAARALAPLHRPEALLVEVAAVEVVAVVRAVVAVVDEAVAAAESRRNWTSPLRAMKMAP